MYQSFRDVFRHSARGMPHAVNAVCPAVAVDQRHKGALGMLTAPPQCALQAQCLPLHLQLTNARAFSGLPRAAVGPCQLTCLRQWAPESAAPSASASSARSQKRRCAVPTRAISPEGPVWDVVALGQSMVDISAYVSDVFIEQMGVAKGARRCGADFVLELHCLMIGSGIL